MLNYQYACCSASRGKRLYLGSEGRPPGTPPRSAPTLPKDARGGPVVACSARSGAASSAKPTDSQVRWLRRTVRRCRSPILRPARSRSPFSVPRIGCRPAWRPLVALESSLPRPDPCSRLARWRRMLWQPKAASTRMPAADRGSRAMGVSHRLQHGPGCRQRPRRAGSGPPLAWTGRHSVRARCRLRAAGTLRDRGLFGPRQRRRRFSPYFPCL